LRLATCRLHGAACLRDAFRVPERLGYVLLAAAFSDPRVSAFICGCPREASPIVAVRGVTLVMLIMLAEQIFAEIVS
jgi:hypothetical protein